MAEQQKQRAILLQSASAFPPPPGVKLSYGDGGVQGGGVDPFIDGVPDRRAGGAEVPEDGGRHRGADDHSLPQPRPRQRRQGRGSQRGHDDAAMGALHGRPRQCPHPGGPRPIQLVFEFVKEEEIPFGGVQSAEVLLGRDTRPSGEALLEAAKQGIAAVVGAIATDMGVLTTPQLHWMVRCRNKGRKVSEFDYYTQLAISFKQLMDLTPQETAANVFDTTVLVDGANGVGGEKLMELKKMLTGLEIHVRNSGKDGEGVLNEGVGADFVQKEKVIPYGFDPNDAGRRCASLDGDADRLIYFHISSASGKKIDLVDGDKILSLFALFIKEQLTILNKDEFKGMAGKLLSRLGVVQTAYANGASTDYLRQLGLEVAFTPTGVKYLHEKASEYDIGIYFEANGHGTILFSEPFIQELESLYNQLASNSPGSDCQKAALRLLSISQLINQAVGDALSGLLLVEAILRHMGWSIKDWSKLYQDLPSRQLKVKVVDRSVVVTSNAETQVVRPSGLQEVIDAETAKHSHGRCFVRPSGTEDVVRVYAEASTQEAADALAQSVAREVDRFLGFGASLGDP